MFTGIIEERGTVIDIEFLPDQAARVAVAGSVTTSDAELGCSIAVDGVCLTVTDLRDDQFTADVMRETLVHTTLGDLKARDLVNLERAMRANDRLGGHLVSGHVDAVGEIVERTASQHWEVVRISVPQHLAKQVAHKGSVAVDGVSLTVSAVGEDPDGSHWFEVSLIPATLSATGLGQKPAGDKVNLETDVLAKYVERLLKLEGRQP